MNFCATKFISFVAFEQLNRPTPQPGFRSYAARRTAAARARASSQVAVRRAPSVRTIGSVSRTSPFFMQACSFPPGHRYTADSRGGGRAAGARGSRVGALVEQAELDRRP